MPKPGRHADPVRRLLLVGAGHTHVEVLRAFGDRPLPGLELVLLTRSTHTPYSGMLPGHVAGIYGHGELHIDAGGLARHAGARLIADEATGLDADRRLVMRADGPPLAYDLLSLDIGSTPNRRIDSPGIPVKPIGAFVEALDGLVEAADGRRTMRIAVVGAGAAGVELAFALKRRLADASPAGEGAGVTKGPAVEIVLVGRDATILPERSGRTQARMARRLAEKGISVVPGFAVEAYEDGTLRSGSERIAADQVLWATESRAAPWLTTSGLKLDDRGFVAVDATLASLSHPNVFAAGDIAALPDPRPKAGVFAVREGPVLADNLRRALKNKALRSYRPQKHWLVLLSSADGHAVADKWGISLEGRWVWWWKDWNDRRFVRRYNRIAERARRKAN